MMNKTSTMTLLWSRLQSVAMLAVSFLSLASCGNARVPDLENKLTMKPSVTYLHLLRHTPFFTALSTEQLQWVIDHSREWEVDAGAVISKCGPTGASDTDYWILLDGGWSLDVGTRKYPSGHADPGKWFNTRESNGAQCAIFATEHGYIMRIAESDMNAMLARGVPFQTHLNAGRAFYQSVFKDEHRRSEGVLW